MHVLGPVRSATRALQGVALLTFPHGGQHVARRNAWAAMSDSSARTRAHHAAAAALASAGTSQHRLASAR